MNSLESDNKLVAYHSFLTCPLLGLQADSHMSCMRNGGAPLMPPRYLYLEAVGLGCACGVKLVPNY